MEMALKESNNEDQEDGRDNAGGVGALLKASRLRLGDDLRFVAETLHIRFIYLEAIEASRYDELPGAAYAVGFIRSYADYLGLDSDEVVRRYKIESTGGSGETKLVFPVPIPESSIPGGAIVFVGVVVALLTYGVWYVSTAKDGFLAGLVTQVPERLSEQEQAEEPEIKVEPVAPAPEVVQTEEPAETAEQPPEEAEKEVAEVAEVAEVSSAPVEESQSETVMETTAEVTTEVTAEVTEEAAQVAESVEEVVEEVEETQQAVVPEVETVVEKVETVVETTPSETAPSEVLQAEVPETTQATEIVQAVAEATPEPSVEAVAEEPTAATEPEPEPEPEPTPAVTETASVPTASPTPTEAQVYGEENDNSRILVKAHKNSWIQVRDNNANRLLLTRLLRAGDSYRVPDQQGLVLLTGNAGALEIYVDGEKVPDLGEAGKVRRNVTLDPDLLRQGSAAN
jgi:cytoskeleton protein RodZ